MLRVACLGFLAVALAFGQAKEGHWILTSGGAQADGLFRKLLGREDANVIYIPTAASLLRTEAGVIWNPDFPEHRNQYESAMASRFGVRRVTILHTRDRSVANSVKFLEPLHSADGVWISGGNAGRLAAAYLDTPMGAELKAVVDRGGVVAGESGGAIILGSYTVRGNPDKPVLMVEGRERGFGLVRDVAINPHLSGSKRENELVSVVDRYPHLLGLGIDDDTGLLVRGDAAEIFGSGRVAIYDNRKHQDGWYYWLKAGERFDLRKRFPIGRAVE